MTCPKNKARPIRHPAQVPDRKGKIFYTSITSLSHISKVAGLDGQAGEDILSAAALMGGYHILEAEQLPDSFLQVIEVAGTAIGFVTQHQAGPLVIAHGVGARVGEQVDKAFFRLQQEGID